MCGTLHSLFENPGASGEAVEDHKFLFVLRLSKHETMAGSLLKEHDDE
jgi:hypothetical protein